MGSQAAIPALQAIANYPPAIASALISLASALQNPTVRLCTAAALPAYTAAGGVLTANANGAISNIDGVAPVLGDRILLTLGAAGADNGVYTVTSVGGASAKTTFTRAADYATGATVPSGTVYEVSEGTAYANTSWKLTTAGASVVDTTSTAFYPREVNQQVALVAGTVTISNVPILSTSKTNVEPTRVIANTATATTGGYCPTVAGANGITAGAVGTGQVIIQACVAAGTINSADISTLNVTITNW